MEGPEFSGRSETDHDDTLELNLRFSFIHKPRTIWGFFFFFKLQFLFANEDGRVSGLVSFSAPSTQSMLPLLLRLSDCTT